MDGKNAVFVAREGDTSSIYVIFYALTDNNNEWSRSGFFVETYEELNEEIPFDYYLTVSEGTAWVGFPQKGTEAGDGAGIIGRPVPPPSPPPRTAANAY